MWYGLCADLVVGIHLAYVAYVIFGQLLIIAGAALKWQWVRNPWFRYTHLLAIAIVAVEAIKGWPCPLTVWEGQLRELAGQTFNGSESFMGKLLHDLLFFDNVPQLALDVGYVATMVLVLQGLIMYPPRWFRTGTRSEAVAPAEYPAGAVATA
ncbi:DUF2784 domain-containing protein [Gemmata sp.]|uniref:DUF2784 domain-containing protein n=1 Tax=Gemmata sp. TaxID=1914242 RepID=UPI003F7181CA